MGEEACADEGSGDGGEVGCKGGDVCFDLVLECFDFVVDSVECGGEWFEVVFWCGECCPAGMSFLEEVGGLYEVVEGVYHLDDLEVFCLEAGLDLCLGDLLGKFMQKCEGVKVGFWVYE